MVPTSCLLLQISETGERNKLKNGAKIQIRVPRALQGRDRSVEDCYEPSRTLLWPYSVHCRWRMGK